MNRNDNLADRLSEAESVIQRVRELLDDPVYAKVIVQESPATCTTVRVDPTELILAADLRAALGGDA